MTESTSTALIRHLRRSDGQEELCFALYRPSSGERRFTAIVSEPLLPGAGERRVHGNVSFEGAYLDRAVQRAVEVGMGIAFLHAHPVGAVWQGMSRPDVDAESGMAGAVAAATGLPLVGLTLAGRSGVWSARQWYRAAPRMWSHLDCENVRVVGAVLRSYRCPSLKPDAPSSQTLVRTVHAWGERLHKDLAALRICVVGLGSVGSLVAEALARMGFGEIVLIDADIIKEHNLDRTVHAYPEDAVIRMPKAILSARSAARSATLSGFLARPVVLGNHDARAYRAALDCDVIFSCVDRPWPRSILNFIAYAHLIPVIDGGIDVSRVPSGGLRSADWGAFIAGPGRRCLECSGQFSSGLVAVEQAGDLDDPEYIESLPADSPLRKRENVFAFSMALASMEGLKLVQLVGRPGGVEAPHEERYTFPAGLAEAVTGAACGTHCAFAQVEARGDHAGDPGLRA